MTFIWGMVKALYLLLVGIFLLGVVGYFYQMHRGVPSPVLQLASPFLQQHHLHLDASETRFSHTGGLTMKGIALHSARADNPPFFVGNLDVTFAEKFPMLGRFKMGHIRIEDGALRFQCSDWEAGASNHTPIVLEELSALIDMDGDQLRIRNLTGELSGIDVQVSGNITLGAMADKTGRTRTPDRPTTNTTARLEPVVQSLLPLVRALSAARYEQPPRLLVHVDLDASNPADRLVQVELDAQAPGWIAGKSFDAFKLEADINRLNINLKQVSWEHDGLKVECAGRVKPGSKTLTHGHFVYRCDDETSGFHTKEPVVLDEVTAAIDLLDNNHLVIHQFDTMLAGVDLRIKGDVALPSRPGEEATPDGKREPLSREALEPLIASALPIWNTLVAARLQQSPVMEVNFGINAAQPEDDHIDLRLKADAPGWIAGLKFDTLAFESNIGREQVEVRELHWQQGEHHASFVGTIEPKTSLFEGTADLKMPAPLLFHLLPEKLANQIHRQDIYIPGEIAGSVSIGPAPLAEAGRHCSGQLSIERLRYKGTWVEQIQLDAGLQWPHLSISQLKCRVGEAAGSGPAQIELDMNLETLRFRTHARLQSDPKLLIPLAPANEDLYRSFEFFDTPPNIDIWVGGISGDPASGWVRGKVIASNAVFRSTLLDSALVDVLHTNRVTTLSNIRVTRNAGLITGNIVIDNHRKSLALDLASTADFIALSHLAGPGVAKTLKSIELDGQPEMQVRGTVDLVPGRGDHQLQGTARAVRGGFDWLSLERPELSWSLRGKTFTIEDLHAGYCGGHLSGGATITELNQPGQDPRLTLDVGLEQGRLEQVDIPGVRLETMEFNGPFNTRLNLTGLLGKRPFHETMDLSGTLEAQDALVRGVKLAEYRSGITYANNVTTFPDIVARDAAGTASGSLEFDSPKRQLRVVLDSTADVQGVAQIAGEAVARSLGALSIKGPNRLTLAGVVDQSGQNQHQLDGTFDFANGGINWIVLDTCNLNWNLNGPTLSMPDVKGTYHGGRFQGAAAISNLYQRTPPQLALQFDLEDAQLAAIEWPGRDPDNKISGRLSSTAELRGPLGVGPFQDTMSGEGRVKIRNGEIFRVSLLGGLSKILSKLIPGFGIATQSDLDANITIADKQARLDNLKLLGDVISAKGSFTYHFDHRIDGKVNIELFKKGVLTDIVRLITSPLSFFLEVKLSGTTDNPEWRLQKIPKELQGIF